MKPIFLRSALLALVVSFLSCSTYQRYELPKSRVQKINESYLAYYLVDPAHPLTRVWYMSESKVKDTEVTCFLSKMTELEAADVTKVRSRRDARWSKNDVLFYANPRFAATLPDTGNFSIPMDQLEKIEVYELNYAKTVGTPLLYTSGLLLLLFAISGGE
jgi:hypothetical protein